MKYIVRTKLPPYGREPNEYYLRDNSTGYAALFAHDGAAARLFDSLNEAQERAGRLRNAQVLSVYPSAHSLADFKIVQAKKGKVKTA
jgi:hypothetical protein